MTVARKKPVFLGSLAVAEASRDRIPHSGFLAGLFEKNPGWQAGHSRMMTIRCP